MDCEDFVVSVLLRSKKYGLGWPVKVLKGLHGSMGRHKETAAPEPGSGSQPIVIIGELRLKVATGSRTVGEPHNGGLKRC